ncbi:MAG TPA: ABC transporter permease [Anaerolineales bacterium]
MWSYLVRRLAQAFLILFIITMLCFVLTRLSSDPMAQYANHPNMTAKDREEIRARLGLDQPIPIQYVKWLSLALHGDLGASFFSHQSVLLLIRQRLPLTLILMGTSEVFIVIFALILGLVSALKQYSFLDNLITSFSFIGFSMPIFFIALACIEIFAVQFKLWGLPYLPTGADIWNPKDPIALARHLVLPVFCLVAIQTAGYSRYLRSSILEILGMDYVRTAHAKGLSRRTVLFKHALRNAILPFVTVVGLDIPFLLGGALVTESVFAWPGMGRLFWEYAERGDYPVVLGVLLLTSSAVVFFTIIVDLAYTIVDPRIQLS